jgi:hypothetical protein
VDLIHIVSQIIVHSYYIEVGQVIETTVGAQEGQHHLRGLGRDQRCEEAGREVAVYPIGK